jgi:hypothetical protein
VLVARALEFPEEIVPFLNQRGRCDDVVRTGTADEDAGLGFERAKRTFHFRNLEADPNRSLREQP